MLTDTLKSLVVGALFAALLFGLVVICVAYQKVFWGFWFVAICWAIGGLLRTMWDD